MDIQQVALFSGYCSIFEENRQIPIYYYDGLGKLEGRKYMHYDGCDDCPLSHNFFQHNDCCPIYISKLKNNI